MKYKGNYAILGEKDLRNLCMAGKLKFAQNLYLGEGIAPEKLDKLKKRLNKKPLLANVYLITPARNPADQLDIFDARQLAQPHYKDEEFLVLGMASGYEDALQLIERITGECLKARGDCNLREYLLC